MTRWTVWGVATHHTTDRYCCTTDVAYVIPPFLISAATVEDAITAASTVVCPMAEALQYESVSLELHVERAEDA